MLTKNDGTAQYPVPWSSSGASSANSTSFYKNSNGIMKLVIRNDTYTSYTFEGIMRYTKSTD